MAAGTRPDWENVGIEFRKEVRAFGKAMIQKIRALPLSEQVSKTLPFLAALHQPMLGALAEMLEDPEIRQDLLPRFKDAMGHPMRIELIDGDRKTHTLMLSTKDQPPYFEVAQQEPPPDTFGLRFLFRDVLDLVESCLEEGRFTVPDILDFYCRGKMQLIMLKQRAEWTGMSLFGGLMFYAPQMWATMEKDKTLDKAFQQIRAAAA
jgi:hypothetical protein